MSFFENSSIPNTEPGQNAVAKGLRARIDNEEAPEDNSEPRSSIGSLPWWLAEKFCWSESPTGRMRLSPLPEFLRAVEEDAGKLVEYGYSLLRPEGGSTEASIVDGLKLELAGALESFSALDDRESRAFFRFLSDRATRNAVYAATTQYEIDRWVAKSAARGQDASEHDNFALKETRRDSFATVAAAYADLVGELLPENKLTKEQYAKTAKQVIFQQADIASREQLSPQQENQRTNHAVQAAVLASRPI